MIGQGTHAPAGLGLAEQEEVAGAAPAVLVVPVSSTGQAMEDALNLYAEPHDTQRPAACFDDTSTQLLSNVRPPLPVEPGKPQREDYQRRRRGARNLFLTCEPLADWRHVAITQRRTIEDFAHQMQWLADTSYPNPP